VLAIDPRHSNECGFGLFWVEFFFSGSSPFCSIGLVGWFIPGPYGSWQRLLILAEVLDFPSSSLGLLDGFSYLPAPHFGFVDCRVIRRFSRFLGGLGFNGFTRF